MWWTNKSKPPDYEIKTHNLRQAVILCKLLTFLWLKLPRCIVWEKCIFNEKQMLFQKCEFSRINKYFIFYYAKDSYISSKEIIALFWFSFRIWVWVRIPIKNHITAGHLLFIHSYKHQEHIQGRAKQANCFSWLAPLCCSPQLYALGYKPPSVACMLIAAWHYSYIEAATFHLPCSQATHNSVPPLDKTTAAFSAWQWNPVIDVTGSSYLTFNQMRT